MLGDLAQHFVNVKQMVGVAHLFSQDRLVGVESFVRDCGHHRSSVLETFEFLVFHTIHTVEQIYSLCNTFQSDLDQTSNNEDIY